MNREEILAKSQQENHGQDIVNLEVSKNGMQIGWVVIICLLAFVEQRGFLCCYCFNLRYLFLQIHETTSET